MDKQQFNELMQVQKATLGILAEIRNEMVNERMWRNAPTMELTPEWRQWMKEQMLKFESAGGESE